MKNEKTLTKPTHSASLKMCPASFCSAQLRAEFVKNVPRTVNLITAEQQSFVQQEVGSIDYKDDNEWEKLDKDQLSAIRAIPASSSAREHCADRSWSPSGETSVRSLV